MKKNRLTMFFRKVALLLCSVLFLPGSLLYASDVIEITPITNRILAIHFDDGHIDYGTNKDNSIVYNSPLNISSATNVSNFGITSPTDAEFFSTRNPITVGRKSKANDVHTMFPKNGEAQYISEHWIYIELPYELKQGNVYKISLNNLATNGNEYDITFDATNIRSESVHINQVGYKSNTPKYAYISQWMGDFDNGTITGGKAMFPDYIGKRFDVVRVSDGVSVYSGNVQLRKNLTDGGPTGTPDDGAPYWWPCGCNMSQSYTFSDVLEADFSAVTTPGAYKIVVQDMGTSFDFEIADDIFRTPTSHILRGLFFQRQGIVRELPDGSLYKRDYHPDDIGEANCDYIADWRWMDDPKHEALKNYSPSGHKLPIWGWYHDAGDPDGYPQHGNIPIMLNLLYDLQPQNFKDGDVGNRYKLSESDANWIDEGNNGIPDLLDEAAWLMRYYKRAKDAGLAGGFTTGGVPGGYGGVDNVTYGTPSWNDTRGIAFSAEDPFQTYMYAATAAYYGANLKTFGGGSHPEAASWINEAEDAWTWAQNNTLTGDDAIWKGNLPRIRAVAAAALYKATGKAVYQTSLKNDLPKDSQYNKKEEGWGNPHYWEYTASIYALLPANHPNLDVAFQNQIKDILISVSETEFIEPHDKRGYRVAFDWQKAHILGMQSTPMLTSLLTAAKFTGDSRYYDAIANSASFFLGGNPEHLVWTTGLGDKPIKYPFHPDSWHLNDYNSKVYGLEVVPGIVNYGSYEGPDFFGWGFQFAGDEDYSKSTMYPTYEYQTWPIMEQRVENRVSIPGGEFTVWQNMAPSIMTYGFLAGNTTGSYNFNERPTVAIVAPSTISSKGATLSANTSNDAVRVDYYFEEHFIGSSTNKEDNFSYFWDPPMTSGNVLVTAVAYDDKGLKSVPTSAVDKTVTISGSAFTSVSSVSINQGSSVFIPVIGQSTSLTASISPSNASNKTLYWASSDITVVTVDNNGNVQSNGPGTAIITVTSADGSKTAQITVEVSSTGQNPVTGISISSSSEKTYEGETVALTATLSPANASNKKVYWTSSNPSVASVNSNGLVTAIAAGTTTITVRSDDGDFTKTSFITVKPPFMITCENAVPNGNFENGTTNWTTTALTISSDAYQGSSAGKLGPAASGTEGSLIAVQGGYQISLSVFAKLTDSTSWSGIGLDILDANGNEIDEKAYRVTETSYTEITDAFVLPSAAANVKFWAWKGGEAQSLLLDNFCLQGNALDVDGDGNYYPATGVNISSDAESLEVGETVSLSATVLPSNASNKAVSWSSNQPNIATVNSAGVVTAVAAGTATITVTTADGGHQDYSTITVTSVPVITCNDAVPNGDFENGTSNWSGSVLSNSSDAHTGSSAAKLGTAQGGMESDLVPVEGNKDLTFTAYAKVSGSVGWTGIGIDFLDASGNELGERVYQVTQTSYTEFTETFTLPSGTVNVKLWGWKGGTSGSLIADDFCLAGPGLDVTPGGGGGTDPDPDPSTVRIEAEDANSLTNAYISNVPGDASNDKFVDCNGSSNITWVHNTTAGDYNLTFAVVAPSGTRTMGVFVNNNKVGVVSTSAPRYQWETVTVSATLQAGDNTIELRDSESANELDVDYIEITGAGSARFATSNEPSIAAETLSIFPNPVSGNKQLFIGLENGSLDNVTIQLYNMNGKSFNFDYRKVSSNKLALDLSKVSRGMYFITVKTQNNTITEKLVVR